MTVTGFEYLILSRIDFNDFFFLRFLLSFSLGWEDISNTNTVLDHIFKHRKESWKYDA